MFLDTGSRSAQENMAIDAELLAKVGQLEGPLLHLYEWENLSVTFGHFADPGKLLNLGNCHGLDLGRRPTGGGVIFHTHDLAFSFLVPKDHYLFGSTPLESYRRINSLIIEAISPLLPKGSTPLSLLPEEPCSPVVHYCMARPTKYDLLQGNKKVGGAAQRRTKEGLLHQGSLFLHLPPLDFLSPLVPENILTSIAKESTPLFSSDLSLKELRASVVAKIKSFLENEETKKKVGVNGQANST
jgi:lipoate-protein ligase A